MVCPIEIHFLNRRNKWFRLDVFPFIVLYSLTLFSGLRIISFYKFNLRHVFS